MWNGHPNLNRNKLEETLYTPDDSDIGYFVEVDLGCPNNIKEKTTNFPIAPENKSILKEKNNDYKNKIKPKTNTSSKNLSCDWTDKKKFLIQYRMLNFM